MKIYLAASMDARDQMVYIQVQLTEAGHEVTSTWVTKPNDSALQDHTDILNSDLVIVFTDVPSTFGGLWVELGLALGANIPVMTIGAPAGVLNIFQKLCPHYWDWDDAYRNL